MSAARTERLLNLLTLLLNTRRPISLREIREMDEFAAYCTADPKSGERAFERDKAALIELGVPLRWVAPELDDDVESSGIGGYIVDRERYYLESMELTPAEAALSSIAGSAAVAMPHFPGRTAVIRALAKIGFDVDESEPTATLAHSPLPAGHDARKIGAFLQTLHDAVARRRVVRLTYRGSGAGRTEREVEPWGLYYRQGIWYLVGHCRLRDGERTFHLGRMEAVEPVGSKIAEPSFEIPASFDLSEHIARRPWEFPNAPAQEVTIRLAARLVPAITELFGPRARVERLESGQALVRIDVTHREGLVTAVLPLGAAAEVLAPEQLRTHLGDIYAQLARRYGGSGP